VVESDSCPATGGRPDQSRLASTRSRAAVRYPAASSWKPLRFHTVSDEPPVSTYASACVSLTRDITAVAAWASALTYCTAT
jgi:hypothetical protein